MTLDDLRAALSNPNVLAFLRVIRAGESTQDDRAYTIQYGGGHFAAPPWDHPRKAVAAGGHVSTAAGAYQFLAATWDALVARYRFPDFSPQCQDEAAVALIHGRKALEDVKAGNFDAAIAKCGKEWASLPGSPYGQRTMTSEEARDVYTRWGGRFDAAASAEPPAFDPDSLATEHYDGREPYQHTPPVTPPAPKKETTMAVPLIPIFTALLPTITQLIPALAQIFKPGSEVAQRNVAAATVVTRALTEATQSPNLQAAIEKMQEDPEAVRRATAAVTAPEIWGQLVEVGGGIEAARKQDQSQSGDWRKLVFSLPFVGLLVFMPTIWAVVAAAVFKADWLVQMDPQLRGTVIGFVLGTLGAGIVGYIYGSSMTKAPASAQGARS